MNSSRGTHQNIMDRRGHREGETGLRVSDGLLQSFVGCERAFGLSGESRGRYGIEKSLIEISNGPRRIGSREIVIEVAGDGAVRAPRKSEY